jgi:Mn2+/Fe2+ NRAMP family transporter
MREMSRYIKKALFLITGFAFLITAIILLSFPKAPIQPLLNILIVSSVVLFFASFIAMRFASRTTIKNFSLPENDLAQNIVVSKEISKNLRQGITLLSIAVLILVIAVFRVASHSPLPQIVVIVPFFILGGAGTALIALSLIKKRRRVR